MGMGGCEQQARLEDSPGCSSVGSRGHDDTGNQECGFHVLLWVSGPSVGASQAIFDLLPTAALVVWYYFTSVFEKREPKLKNIRTLAPAEVGLDPGLSVPRSPCCGEGSTRAPPGAARSFHNAARFSVGLALSSGRSLTKGRCCHLHACHLASSAGG